MPSIRAIKALLDADPTASVLLADRIYPVEKPQALATLPTVVLTRISQVDMTTPGSAHSAALLRDRVQVDIEAADLLQLAAVANAIAAALTFRSGTAGGVAVQHLEHARQGEPNPDDQADTVSRSDDYMVTYFEP